MYQIILIMLDIKFFDILPNYKHLIYDLHPPLVSYLAVAQ